MKCTVNTSTTLNYEATAQFGPLIIIPWTTEVVGLKRASIFGSFCNFQRSFFYM